LSELKYVKQPYLPIGAGVMGACDLSLPKTPPPGKRIFPPKGITKEDLRDENKRTTGSWR